MYLAQTIDWNPIIVAIAGFIIAITPGIAAFIQAHVNYREILHVKSQTDGALTDLIDRVGTVEKNANGGINASSTQETGSRGPAAS